jgi:hypothetical protein
MTYSGSTVAPKELTIGKEGAQFFESALSVSQLSELESVLAAQPRDHAGVRLSAIPELRPFLNQAGPVGQIPALVLGPGCLPVRAILFDKSAEQELVFGVAPGPYDRSQAAHRHGRIRTLEHQERHGPRRTAIRSAGSHGHSACPPRRRADYKCAAASCAGITQARPDSDGGNSRCRSSMRRHSMSGRSWGCLALCDAHSSRVRCRRRGIAPPSATG